MMRAGVSMADVAARAGVSGQTVSRVVNGSSRVDPNTRNRVEAAMAELGYRPHRAARALRTGRTHTIGLVVTTLATVGNSLALQAAVAAAEARGYAITIVTTTDRIVDAFARLEGQGVDGVLVLNEASALLVPDAIPRGMRVVAADTTRGAVGHVVRNDHYEGAVAATRHLLELGHASVHHVAGPTDSFAATERERGWRDARAEAGEAALPALRGDWSADSGQQLAAELQSATAVFCANDEMALGLVHGLALAGRRVPEDVSVVGFDDVADAAHYLPPLTTVRQDFQALGLHAVTTLLDLIEDTAGPKQRAGSEIVLSPELVVRGSTAPPARTVAPS